MNSKQRETLDRIIAIAEKQKRDTCKKTIYKQSPYSDTITRHISSVTELEIYMSLDLTESYIHRPALIMTIDPNYLDTKTGKTNIQRMLNGDPPLDNVTGEVIELHHMAQKFDGPYVELTHNNHIGSEYNLTLHPNTHIPSWRYDKEKNKQFQQDRKKHWITRAKKFYDETTY